MRIRPLDQFPDLYLELARSKSTLATQRLFAKKYGLLTHRVRESTSLWPGLVNNMNNLAAMVADTGNCDIRDRKHLPYECRPRRSTALTRRCGMR